MEGRCLPSLAIHLCAALTPRISTSERAWLRSCPSARSDLGETQQVSEVIVHFTSWQPPRHQKILSLCLEAWLLARYLHILLCLDLEIEGLVKACDTTTQFPYKACAILCCVPLRWLWRAVHSSG